MLIIDALIVILCILIGVRKGGIAVAFAGAFGLAILTFICGLRPTAHSRINAPGNPKLMHQRSLESFLFLC